MRLSIRGRKVREQLSGSDRADKAAGRTDQRSSYDSPLIEWAIDKPELKIGLGDSINYNGDADLVFSHLYGPLPPQLIGKPAIVNLYGNKKERAEQWVQAELIEVSKWGRGLTNTIYAVNHAAPELDLSDLTEEEFERGRGWMPVELPLRVLKHYSGVVWDGFMGRGTIGKVARDLGLSFVGIDRDPKRVALAMEYIAC
jgi:hypothetical protein